PGGAGPVRPGFRRPILPAARGVSKNWGASGTVAGVCAPGLPVAGVCDPAPASQRPATETRGLEYPMSDEKALLAAIWAEPHDDTPRLVYADWLDENGQSERAEFIRLQCELARLGEWDESPRKAELEAREKQLRARHAMAWKAGLPPSLRQRGGFERGFPAPPRRSMPSSKFLKL